MTRRKFGYFVASALAVLVVSLTPSSAYAMPPWGLASQAQRNAYIVEVANQDVGRNFSLNCKEWARKIVEYASRYGGSPKITLPVTVPNENGWAWRMPTLHIYTAMQSRRIITALPGQIIQMNWTNAGNGAVNPHTAIVGAVSSRTVTFIDSNWPDPKHPGEHNWVQSRTLLWSDVERAVGYKFTIYEIQ